MRKIWQVPIEPLEERYSSQWLRWFRQEFEKLGVLFGDVIATPLSDSIRQGSFLDVIGTNYYKSQQLQHLCLMFEQGRIEENDIIFLHDGWFPGIEMLAYIRDALGIKFKIYAIFHAGTYDPYDFLTQKGMRRWGAHLERSWFTIYDGIFVATDFHKELILNQRKGFFEYQGHNRELANKIFVTGLPIYPDFAKPDTYKENIIVFPHRLDPEKQPEMFQKLRTDLVDWKFGWNMVNTKDLCKSKQQYYNLLNKAKISVSCALQETWGIAMIESVMCGCIPMVPDRLSYKELYPTNFRYVDYDDLIQKIKYFVDNYDLLESLRLEIVKNNLIEKGRNAIQNMVDIMVGK